MMGWRVTMVRACPKCRGPLYILQEGNVIHFMFRCDPCKVMVQPNQGLKI